MNFSQKSCFSPKRITRLHKIAQKSYYPHRFALNTYPDPTTASAFISPNRITRLHKTSNKSYVLHGFVLNTYPDPTIASSFIAPNRITRLHKVFEITQVSLTYKWIRIVPTNRNAAQRYLASTDSFIPCHSPSNHNT